MINVFDGDPEPLLDIILDANADEFVRSRMCEALTTLVLTGAIDRKRAARGTRRNQLIAPRYSTPAMSGCHCRTISTPLDWLHLPNQRSCADGGTGSARPRMRH